MSSIIRSEPEKEPEFEHFEIEQPLEKKLDKIAEAEQDVSAVFSVSSFSGGTARKINRKTETFILTVAMVLYLTTVALDFDLDLSIFETASYHALLCICMGVMADPSVGLLRIALRLALTPVIGLVLRHYAGQVTRMMLLSVSCGCLLKVSTTAVFIKEIEKPRDKWRKLFAFVTG